MATKTVLLEVNRANQEIFTLFKLKSYLDRDHDVEIYGPDDRRADTVIEEDPTLGKDLRAICEKAWTRYRTEMGKFLSVKEAERTKVPPDKLEDFDNDFGDELVKLASVLFRKLDSTTQTETKKRWAKYVSSAPGLKSVRFDTVLVPFDVVIWFKGKPAAKKEEWEDAQKDREVGMRITEAQIVVNVAVKAMQDPAKLLAKTPWLIRSVNATADAVQKDYDKGPRESQKDDPDTQGHEEPDEDLLNEAIFKEHNEAMIQAYADVGNIDTAYFKAGEEARASAKSLMPALKKLGTSSRQKNIPPDTAQAIGEKADVLGDAIKELVAIESETKKARIAVNESQAEWELLSQKKGAALGLIAKGRVEDVKLRERWDAVLKTLAELKVALVPGQ